MADQTVIICPQCKCKIEDKGALRCPRCYKILTQQVTCQGCGKCSTGKHLKGC